MAGYLIDVTGIACTLKSTFIGSIESTDGQKVKLIGNAFPVIVSLFVLYYQYLMDFAKEARKRMLPLVLQQAFCSLKSGECLLTFHFNRSQ